MDINKIKFQLEKTKAKIQELTTQKIYLEKLMFDEEEKSKITPNQAITTQIFQLLKSEPTRPNDYDNFKNRCKVFFNLNDEQFEDAIQRLKRGGSVYEPKRGFIDYLS